MADKYFSEKEKGTVERTSEEINENVWNGIFVVYESLISENKLSGKFPEQCQDERGICGCNRSQLERLIRAEIPTIDIPIKASYEEIYFDDDLNQLVKNIYPEKYAILDFIEFLHKNIKDAHEIDFHSLFNHSHYRFSDAGEAIEQYQSNINKIFSRNGIVFYLNDDGLIERTVPESLKKIVTDIQFSTNDERLNELLDISYSKFILPKAESRVESLEKIWDAFERIKTYYDKNKKRSASTLVSKISSGNDLFETHIEIEFK